MDAVIAGEDSDFAGGADPTLRIGAVPDAHVELDDVPRHAPPHRVMRGIVEVATDRQDDLAITLVPGPVDLADNSAGSVC
jgi:hypothetical protein